MTNPPAVPAFAVEAALVWSDLATIKEQKGLAFEANPSEVRLLADSYVSARKDNLILLSRLRAYDAAYNNIVPATEPQPVANATPQGDSGDETPQETAEDMFF